jgi:hypothetical protein
MIRNFLFTGTGRTGTMFLAHLLNRSPSWTVAHEPKMPGARTYSQPLFSRMHPLVTDVGRVQERFKRDRYGEVNSLLRYVAHRLDVAYIGVLLRHPKDVWLSAFNKHKGRCNGSFWELLAVDLALIDSAIQGGVPYWYFERYTRELPYLQSLVEACGIDDLGVTPAMLKPSNAAPKLKKSFTALPTPIQRYYDRECSWFEDRYYGKNAYR